MATLTHNQKETIKNLKLKISETAFTIAKIQYLSPIEQNLLRQALNYVVVDKVGDYEGRFMELHKYQYMLLLLRFFLIIHKTLLLQGFRLL